MDKTIKEIVDITQDMSEEEAKETLAEIFIYMRKVGIGGYSDEQCYKDIEHIFKKKVVTKLLKQS